jgi:FkbM family methyltransferase
MPSLDDLRALAACFDLEVPEERKRSAAALRSLFIDLVCELGPPLTAEIGAFDADFSRTIKRRLPQTRALAFEANPYNHSAMSPAAKADGVDYRHMALSDQDGTAMFNIVAQYGADRYSQVKGNDSLLQRTLDGIVYEKVEVPSARADTVFGAPDLAGQRACLWVDVEGAAGAVLEGAQQLLRRTDAILIEVEHHRYWENQWLAGDVDAALQSAGLRPAARDFEYEHQHNLVYVSPAAASLGAYDFLMCRYFSAIGRR